MTPAQVAGRAKLDQLLAEFRDTFDGAGDMEIAFMRRIAQGLLDVSRQAPDPIYERAAVLCATAITAAIAESHDRRNDTPEEVS